MEKCIKSINIYKKASNFATVDKSNSGYMLNTIQNNLNPKNGVYGNRIKDL